MEHLHPTQAYEMLQGNPNTLLIDCRTDVEHYFVGHPHGAISIEWNTAKRSTSTPSKTPT